MVWSVKTWKILKCFITSTWWQYNVMRWSFGNIIGNCSCARLASSCAASALLTSVSSWRSCRPPLAVLAASLCMVSLLVVISPSRPVSSARSLATSVTKVSSTRPVSRAASAAPATSLCSRPRARICSPLVSSLVLTLSSLCSLDSALNIHTNFSIIYKV